MVYIRGMNHKIVNEDEVHMIISYQQDICYYVAKRNQVSRKMDCVVLYK